MTTPCTAVTLPANTVYICQPANSQIVEPAHYANALQTASPAIAMSVIILLCASYAYGADRYIAYKLSRTGWGYPYSWKPESLGPVVLIFSIMFFMASSLYAMFVIT